MHNIIGNLVNASANLAEIKTQLTRLTHQLKTLPINTPHSKPLHLISHPVQQQLPL